MQATNSSNTSATLNGYTLTAAAPSLGPNATGSSPVTAQGSKPQPGRAGNSVGRRLLNFPALTAPHNETQVWFERQQQLSPGSSACGSVTRVQRLPTVLSQHAQQLLSRAKQACGSAAAQLAECAAPALQHAQRAQQLLSSVRQTFTFAAAKLASCAGPVPQHAQHSEHAQHAQQLLSRTRQVSRAMVGKLAGCAAALSQHAQQSLSNTRQALKAAVAKLAGCTAAVSQHQAAQLLGRLTGVIQRRVLATDANGSVDLEVTVNVPSGQSGSATQASIEAPGFAPALQQSLSDAGMQYETFD